MLKRVVNSRHLQEDNCWFDAVGCASCEQGYQSVIDDCIAEIERYDQMYNKISDKIAEANILSNSFKSGNEAAKFSNMNINFDYCTNCISDLVSTFEQMQSECTKEKNDWIAKKKQAEIDKSNCAANNTHCD